MKLSKAVVQNVSSFNIDGNVFKRICLLQIRVQNIITGSVLWNH